MAIAFHPVEVLESRIAPSIFFVGTATTGSDALAVHKGNDLAGTSASEMAAKTAAGSTVAVLLKAGDTLVFDADNSHTQNAGDTLLLKVTGGQTMVFLTDGAGATTGGFDQNEITGLAVSDKFKAEAFADIRGSVVTALNGAGEFTVNATNNSQLDLTHGSVGGFKSDGQIGQYLLAGGSVSKVSLGAALTAGGLTAFSVQRISTGMAASGLSVSFNGGSTTFTTALATTAGENGGSISDVTLAKGALNIEAGKGIDSLTGNGGAGGSLSKITMTDTPSASGMTVKAGAGGSGFAKAGAGGSITNSHFTTTGTTGNWSFVGGAGGAAAKFAGGAGAGGSISGVSLETAAVSGFVTVIGGAGGNSPTGKAGVGGSANDFTLTNHGSVTGAVSIFSGDGGDLTSADGRSHHAGNSGAISKVTLNNQGGLSGFQIASGAGGDITNGQGSAGSSGMVSNVTIHESATDSGTRSIHSGEGGIQGATSTGLFPVLTGQGNGGSSGNLSNISITDTVGGGSPFEVYAGVPVSHFVGGGKLGSTVVSMQGVGPASKGGSIGSINGVKLDGVNSSFLIGKSDAAGAATGNAETIGGSAGSITNVSGKVGSLDLLAPSGGDGGAKGGVGGSISKVTITTATQFVHLIAAGDGGDGLLAGAGGAVSSVKVTGDIGNFTANFGLTTASNTMGGLVAGLRGLGGGSAVNGSITNVSATKIAAILAGRPAANAIGYTNGVTKLSKITATVIGADVNGDTMFDFTPGGAANTTYQPDNNGTPTDGDTALDGLVIVKKGGGGAALPVAPLKLIEV